MRDPLCLFSFPPSFLRLGEADLDLEKDRDLLCLLLFTSTSEPIGEESSLFDPADFVLVGTLLLLLRDLDL